MIAPARSGPEQHGGRAANERAVEPERRARACGRAAGRVRAPVDVGPTTRGAAPPLPLRAESWRGWLSGSLGEPGGCRSVDRSSSLSSPGNLPRRSRLWHRGPRPTPRAPGSVRRRTGLPPRGHPLGHPPSPGPLNRQTRLVRVGGLSPRKPRRPRSVGRCGRSRPTAAARKHTDVCHHVLDRFFAADTNHANHHGNYRLRPGAAAGGGCLLVWGGFGGWGFVFWPPRRRPMFVSSPAVNRATSRRCWVFVRPASPVRVCPTGRGSHASISERPGRTKVRVGCIIPAGMFGPRSTGRKLGHQRRRPRCSARARDAGGPDSSPVLNRRPTRASPTGSTSMQPRACRGSRSIIRDLGVEARLPRAGRGCPVLPWVGFGCSAVTPSRVSRSSSRRRPELLGPTRMKRPTTQHVRGGSAWLATRCAVRLESGPSPPRNKPRNAEVAIPPTRRWAAPMVRSCRRCQRIRMRRRIFDFQ